MGGACLALALGAGVFTALLAYTFWLTHDHSFHASSPWATQGHREAAGIGRGREGGAAAGDPFAPIVGAPRAASAVSAEYGVLALKRYPNHELWGDLVPVPGWVWGKPTFSGVPSADECERRCHEFSSHGPHADNNTLVPIKCNTFVFCGEESCGEQKGDCWLKRQQSPGCPGVRAQGPDVPYTSGTLGAVPYVVDGTPSPATGKEVVLSSAHGDIRIRLRPDWSPKVANYIWEQALRGATSGVSPCLEGCFFYRAEPMWFKPPGPPYAILQGSMKLEDVGRWPVSEGCHPPKRSTVTWIGEGPHFHIALDDHDEWGVGPGPFGTVTEESLDVANRITLLPTKVEMWGKTRAQVLLEPLPFKLLAQG